MPQVILAYIPVLHQGYWQLFSQFPQAQKLYILSHSIAQKFTPVHKELRALDQSLIIKAIEGWDRFETIEIADEHSLDQLNHSKVEVIIPDELVTTQTATIYLPDSQITKSSIFLRWDKRSATQENIPVPNHTTAYTNTDLHLLVTALEEGQKSSDWWRQVGALAVRDGKILAQAHNTHLPSEQQPYAEGDPRAHFHKGEHIDKTTAIHAEAKLIAQAAKNGTILQNSDLYVTDFPCPTCAKLIAEAGIARVFYQKGYAVLDGERVLRAAQVEIIQVT